jgi:biotin carboxylase
VQLVADTEEEAERDLEAIHALEELGLFDYSVICPTPPVTGAVVIVDPFSTGANIAATVVKMGFKLIVVMSELDSPVSALVSQSTNLSPTLMIQHDNKAEDQERATAKTIEQISSQGAPVLAIIPGAETGVELADKLAFQYGTRNNGVASTRARRDKHLMQEVIRAKGIRAIQQQLCRTEAEIEAFVRALPNKKCVIKPNESAGTDSVFLCKSDSIEDLLVQAKGAFNQIHGQINGLGHINDGALCQEFLEGTEYVIDGCSRDGVYKVTCIWEYDKRSVNGANFVYYGMKSLSPEGPKAREMIDYMRKVVQALDITHGPSHAEVMYTETGPCLVEVGSRCHGGEGSWLPVAQECIGYTQVDATLSCYLRPDRFDALPLIPTLLKQGREAFLVSYQEGKLESIPGLDIIRNMSSFRSAEMLTQPGNDIKLTIDCFTRPGSVQMVNASIEEMEKDYLRIRDLETSGLFKCK